MRHEKLTPQTITTLAEIGDDGAPRRVLTSSVAPQPRGTRTRALRR